jgi:A/G-specific adenine glycosylase
MSDFAHRLINWHKTHGRHDLPWQNTRDPYRIWVSEIMLQQTQVLSVIPYFQRFLTRFPDIASLAAAPIDAVLAHWSGLGYYARARNLHAAAQQVVARHAGQFPQAVADIAALPGIGRSTAAAIGAFAFGTRGAILDGNVKRVLARCFGIAGYPGELAVQNRLWAMAESLLPAADIEIYTQALMDLGATLCTRGKPRCGDCPLQAQCVACQTGRSAELPTAKPRAALPQRETVVLILQHGGEVLLEKRPASGVWGGLWSFPEIEAAAILQARLMQGFGVQALRVMALAPLAHSFTHFHLTLRPLWVATSAPAQSRPGQVWLALEEARGAAIPTPVRKLLDRL